MSFVIPTKKGQEEGPTTAAPQEQPKCGASQPAPPGGTSTLALARGQTAVAKRAARPAKDSNAPKKPLSAYMHWAKVTRAAVQSDLGNLSVPEIGKELGRRWAALEPAARLPYQQLAATERDQYKVALRTYNTSASSSGASTTTPKGKLTKKQRQAARDPAAPKKPLTSFLLWSQQEREAVRNELEKRQSAEAVSVAAIGKELGRRWSCLEAAVKKTFEDRAAAAKEEYLQALASYQPAPEFLQKRRQLEEAAAKAAAKKQKKAAKDPATPKRPQTAFLLWASANREQTRADIMKTNSGAGSNNNPSGPEIMKELARRWALVDADSRAKYEQQSKEDNLRYQEAMVQYRLTAKKDQQTAQATVQNGQQSALPTKGEGRSEERKQQHQPGPFQTWAREQRAQVREELGGPTATSLAVNRELAIRWKALDKETKASYKTKRISESGSASEDKENATATSPAKKPRLAKVQRPRDSFHHYLIEMSRKIRAESVDKMSHKQILEVARQRWDSLTPGEQQIYHQRAQQEEEEAQRGCGEEAAGGGEGAQEAQAVGKD